MNVLRLLPIYISALLMGAHFLRGGALFLAVVSLLFPVFLFFRHPWAVRLVQTILVLGALEWIRTMILLAVYRYAAGQEWIRLVIILGAVAVFTGASSLVFLFQSLRTRYGLVMTRI